MSKIRPCELQISIINVIIIFFFSCCLSHRHYHSLSSSLLNICQWMLVCVCHCSDYFLFSLCKIIQAGGAWEQKKISCYILHMHMLYICRECELDVVAKHRPSNDSTITWFFFLSPCFFFIELYVYTEYNNNLFNTLYKYPQTGMVISFFTFIIVFFSLTLSPSLTFKSLHYGFVYVFRCTRTYKHCFSLRLFSYFLLFSFFFCFAPLLCGCREKKWNIFIKA